MQQLSAQDALMQARTNIDAARVTRGSKPTIIKHYRAAKKVLDSVSDEETDPSTLNEIVAAFRDLALVLDRSGEPLQIEADKCRRRADALRYTLLLLFHISFESAVPMRFYN